MSERRPETAQERRARIQRQLDEALADSFPASDPVSIVTSQDEEAWERDAQDSAEAPASEAPASKEPSTPASSQPGSRS
jgi:hypothetical protein